MRGRDTAAECPNGAARRRQATAADPPICRHPPARPSPRSTVPAGPKRSARRHCGQHLAATLRETSSGQSTADADRRDLVAAPVIAHSVKPSATLAIGAIAAMAVIGTAALSAVLSVIAARDACSGTGIEATSSAGATRGIPARYGTSRLPPPCEWVKAFAVLPAEYSAAARPGP